MGTVSLKGLGVALVTPFTKDNNIDYKSLDRLIEYHISQRTDYLVVLGTTAETPTLTFTERLEISRYIARKVDGRLPLVLGIGGNCTRAVIEDIERYDLNGYSAILSVAPYYNRPTQQGLYLHFTEIANHSPLPVILYNVPSRTGVNIEYETTVRLAKENANIIGIKEASGKIEQIKKIIENKPSDFQVVSGDDSLTFELIKAGCVGVISVLGNAYPGKFGEMARLCLESRFDEAARIDEKFRNLYKVLFADGNPAGIKSLLSFQGMIENRLRLPLTPVTESTGKKLKEICDIIG